MSASQTIHLIEKLTEANIPKKTAMELLEYVERQQTDLVTKDYLDIKIEAVDAKIEAVETKIEAVDTKIEAVETKIEALDTKIDTKVEVLETKIEALDTKINGVKLFIGFNTALSLAIIAKLFLG